MPLSANKPDPQFLIIRCHHKVSTYLGGHLMHQSSQKKKVRRNSRLRIRGGGNVTGYQHPSLDTGAIDGQRLGEWSRGQGATAAWINAVNFAARHGLGNRPGKRLARRCGCMDWPPPRHPGTRGLRLRRPGGKKQTPMRAMPTIVKPLSS